jgi:ABC-2 type transport system ATP-binding protein
VLFRSSRKYKQTFFINSHNLAEVQRICDRIAIIDEGKILLTGMTTELREKLHGQQEYVIRVVGDIDKAEKIVQSVGFVESTRTEIDTIVVKIEDPLQNNSKLIRKLVDNGVNVVEFSEEEASLEDLYLQTIKGGPK